ncbi:MAG: aspartyl protease family protein [Gammaproteobacteria bacterium]
MRTFLVFLLGLALGVLGTVLLRPQSAPVAQTQSAEAPAATPSSARRQRGDGTVTVVLENAAVSRRVPGIVLRQPAALIIRFDDYVRSERAYWISANGLRHVIDQAIAVDLDIGLIAFAVDDASVDGIALGRERGSLFLGLDVGLIGAAPGGLATVYSAAVERGPNHYRYLLRSAAPPEASLLAVVAPASNELIGLADRNGETPQLYAMDVGTLRDFLDNRLRPIARSMPSINDAIFNQPGGLAREFDDLTRRGRWAAALERAQSLFPDSPERLTPARRVALFESMLREARALVATGQVAAAQSALLENIGRFGANQNVLLELAGISTQLGSTLSAIDTLRQLQYAGTDIRSEDLISVLRTTVERYLGSAERSDSRATQLLFDVLDSDPNHAPYHRQLGSLLFAAGRYQDAEFHLNRAVELDPAYAADVARELDTARQRRQVNTQVEVPLLGSGSGLYVNVKLNGSDQSFRFLLDTGASYSAVNTRTLLRLGLNDIFANGAPLIELETANGRVFAQTFRLQSMNLAGAVVEQVPVVLLEDMGQLDGLVGLSFLRHFDVEINQQDGLLILTPR